MKCTLLVNFYNNMAKILSAKYLKEKIEQIERAEKHKVCIVGIIGHCHLKDKDAICNNLLGKQVFHNKYKEDTNAEVTVKLYHDVAQRTIYLELVSIEDPSTLVEACKNMQEDISLTGQHQYWQSKEHKHFASLLFVFSVCHIVVVSFPSPRFDLNYLRLFKVLASVRHGMLHHICGVLAGIDGIPEIWKTTGRPCIPRIIFTFQVPWIKERSTSTETLLLRIQHSLQEQVHLILRKNRQLGSLSSSSLFTVSSPNPTFVYVQPSYHLFTNPTQWCLDQLLKHSISIDNVLRSFSGKSNQSSILSQPPNTTNDDQLINNRKKTSFQVFVNKQIDYMMTVESREVPAEGRRGTHVEAPFSDLWFRVCAALFEFFLGQEEEVNNHLMNMASSLDFDWKFSESRCRQVIPLATNAYLDNLPSHYTHSVHLSQLSKALHVYTLNARGPAFEHYMGQLQEDCNQIWWNGRQLCEIRSLTGQPCVYPFHRALEDNDRSQHDDSVGIPCKPHSSRVTSIAACNCGRMQGTREDPFDLKVANFEFYQELEKKCCSYLVHLQIPKHSVQERNNFQDTADTPMDMSGHECSQLSLKQELSATDTTSHMSQIVSSIGAMTLSSKEVTHFSVPSVNEPVPTTLSIGFTSQDGEFKDENNSLHLSHQFEMKSATKPDDKLLLQSAVDHTCHVTKRSSTNEFVYTMLTEDTAPELVPIFPSWSLLCLGPASLYNPQKGIEQQGFFSGSNFLLPWEIRLSESVTNLVQMDMSNVMTDDGEDQWPAPGEASKSVSTAAPGGHLQIFQTAAKLTMLSRDLESVDSIDPVAQSPAKQPKGGKEDRSKSGGMKAYIGNEYECPRGHRFICSAPDRVVKSSSNGHMRETASKLLHSDMPLYFPCPCRSAKPPHLAQLSRSYIVTADSHIGIQINPRVQPGEDGSAPVFIPGPKCGISLPRNSFCVLKFPYVYMDDTGPYLPPIDSESLPKYRLLKDMYSFAV